MLFFRCIFLTIFFCCVVACGQDSENKFVNDNSLIEPEVVQSSSVDSENSPIHDAEVQSNVIDPPPATSGAIVIVPMPIDTDNDGIPNHLDDNDDNDALADENDAFPLDPKESEDSDFDGVGNNADTDDDNDGVVDIDDAFPFNPLEWMDSDGDQVGDNSDDFITDIAASVDSDNDGYPDAWNLGFSRKDSMESLNIDAFPRDPECYLPEHGQNGICNYAATMPSFIPQQTLVDENGVVYLYHQAFEKIYRWSIQLGQYLKPLTVGVSVDGLRITPEHISYSEHHNRLYFKYRTGQIRFIHINGERIERDFARVSVLSRKILSTGQYVIVEVQNSLNSTFVSYDYYGNVIDVERKPFRADNLVWDQYYSRLYYVKNNYHLTYDHLDQISGVLMPEERNFYVGQAYSKKLIFSNNGREILLQDGRILNVFNFRMVDRLPRQFLDAAILQRHVVSLQAINTEFSNLSITHRRTKQIVKSINYVGEALGLIQYEDDIFVILQRQGKIIFISVAFEF